MINFQPSSLLSWLAQFYGNAPLVLTPWVVPFDFDDPTASVPVVRTSQIVANADFCLLAFSSRAASLESLDDSTVQFMDAATGEQFFADPLKTTCLCAPGANSANCYPRLIEGNSAIVSTFAPGAGFSPTNVWIGLQGFLIRGMN